MFEVALQLDHGRAEAVAISDTHLRNCSRTAAMAARVTDVVFSLVGIVFLAPLMLVIAILVYVSDPGPILFGHRRIGRDARFFRCLKFRTMVVDAEARLQEMLERDTGARSEWQAEHKLRRDPRITRIGRFLRRSSLDELPQLFNVLVGDMSLVGPRPIVLEEVQRYGRHFLSYCSVRPGITGLWQVCGRNDVSYARRVAMDITYVRRKSLMLDLQIILLTLPSVLKFRGAY